ncbi:MAG: hypothetical protein AB1461_20065 [Thermodesulfobacteriota bacterium]
MPAITLSGHVSGRGQGPLPGAPPHPNFMSGCFPSIVHSPFLSLQQFFLAKQPNASLDIFDWLFDFPRKTDRRGRSCFLPVRAKMFSLGWKFGIEQI